MFEPLFQSEDHLTEINAYSINLLPQRERKKKSNLSEFWSSEKIVGVPVGEERLVLGDSHGGKKSPEVLERKIGTTE